MMMQIGAFAEFERAMLKERTKTGLEAALKGRPYRLLVARSSNPNSRQKLSKCLQEKKDRG